MLQGEAADCNSAGETHAWFDSRVAHHSPTVLFGVRAIGVSVPAHPSRDMRGEARDVGRLQD